MLIALLSLYVLFAPDPGGPEGPPGADKVVHLALFALLAATARWRFGRSTTILLLVLAYAALSELVQALALAQRSGDVLDLLADSAGAALGWAALRRR
ncbi:MAG: hypothetical protein JWO60_1913 [Frankiales bacterium]|nr:hypothetical protein [Frankiales bacterium]